MPLTAEAAASQQQPAVSMEKVEHALAGPVADGMRQIGDVAVEFLLNALSVPVEKGPGGVVRSQPGEFPRMEEDLLRQSTDSNVIQGDGLPFLRISIGPRAGDADVARELEFDLHRPMLTHPEFQQMLRTEAAPELGSAISRRLRT